MVSILEKMGQIISPGELFIVLVLSGYLKTKDCLKAYLLSIMILFIMERTLGIMSFMNIELIHQVIGITVIQLEHL